MFVSVLIMEFKQEALLKKFSRQSILSIVFVVLTFISLLMMVYNAIMEVVNKKKANENVLGFKSYCN